MMRDRKASEGLEIRVHGIGEHHLLSALGSPTVLRHGKKRGAIVVSPPDGVDHELILVNWSRMSRRPLGPFFWYLAFPFTLVNVAFEMRPARPGWRRRVHVGVLAAWSLILTAVTACWTIALFESLLLFVDFPYDWWAHRVTLACGFGAALLVLVILVRARHPESRAHVISGFVHASVVVAIALGALTFRPGEWQVKDYSWVRFFASQGPTNDQIEQMKLGKFDVQRQWDQTPLWLDPIGLISYLALGLCILVAVILAVTWVRSEQGPASGGSFLVLLSGVLTILITSSVHAGVTQLVASYRRWIPILGGFDLLSSLPAGALMSRMGRSYPTTLLPGIGIILLLLLVSSLLYLVFTPKLLSWFPPNRHRPEFLRWTHEAVGHLPRILIRTSVFLVVCALVFGVALVALFRDREQKGEFCTLFMGPDCLPTYLNVIGWLAGISAVASFFIVRRANSLPALRNVLASTADVVGFWPITLQPLGARTYRRDAVRGITEALTVRPDQRRVLVGHSQGSVLAAWAVANHAAAFEKGTRPALVTCGTPLGSLYFKFFPQTFDKDLFSRIVTESDGWANFWRSTDPIATPLAGPDEDPAAADRRNTEIRDPLEAGERVYGHSDYWIADKQLSWIANYLNPALTTTQPNLETKHSLTNPKAQKRPPRKIGQH